MEAAEKKDSDHRGSVPDNDSPSARMELEYKMMFLQRKENCINLEFQSQWKHVRKGEMGGFVEEPPLADPCGQEHQGRRKRVPVGNLGLRKGMKVLERTNKWENGRRCVCFL